VRRDTVAAHRRLAYVAGGTNLWPSLTGAETLHLLGQVQGRVDPAYREELMERFAFDSSKKVRSYSKGNRQKLGLIAGLMSRADLLLLDEPTSGLDPLMEREFRRCVREAKDAGQTVFLSSHVLSEVETLADRVAILRAGRLVEIGTLAEMRHLSALSVEATFTSTPPNLSTVPGLSEVEVEGNRVRPQVRGTVEPLLERLTAVGVSQILNREPSLEELFLAQYGAEPSVETREVVPSGR
jgi:ABC-2 type transport system ATP-binding protein